MRLKDWLGYSIFAGRRPIFQLITTLGDAQSTWHIVTGSVASCKHVALKKGNNDSSTHPTSVCNP